jgi:hypothetical protein
MSSRWICLRMQPVILALAIILGAAARPSSGAEGVTAVSENALVAYAWSGQPKRHVIPMYWVTERRDLADVSLAKAATETMPDGHRVLFLWRDFVQKIDRHRDDCCRNAEGNLTEIRGIWWDRGAAETAAQVDRWFAEYQRLGGRVNTIVLDYEASLTNWSLGNNAARYRAIENDPRFESVAAKLGFGGLAPVMNWRSGDAHRKWNALMEHRQTEYINRAVFEPIRRHFPNVRMANYGYYYNTPTSACPDRNGYEHARFGMGTHIGTHQSAPLYGWLGSARWSRVQGTALERSGDGPEYGVSPFAAFRLSVNRIRSMQLSSEVPLMPWISHKRFQESLLRNNDLYQELIFHAALTGPDVLLFWNPQHQLKTQDPDHFTTPEQEQLLSDCLVEFNGLAGSGRGTTLIDRLAGWADDYVLTGMNYGNQSLWRFTPRTAEGERVEMAIVQKSPAIVRTGTATITIARSRILDGTVSAAGMWITAPENSRPVRTAANPQ